MMYHVGSKRITLPLA